jgi:YegS/Rv2252/BmrU family lipid kinase
MKRAVVIANPFSGTSSKVKLSDALHKINNGYFDLDVQFTEYAGHGKILAKNCVDAGVDIIIAAGGDGTVNEVGAEVKGSKSVLGILPGGSGNGFAMHLGLGRDTIKAFDFIKKNKVKDLDTCEVNGKFFINVSGLGFDARIAFLTKFNKKRGFMHYFLTTMKESRNFTVMDLIVTTENEKIEGKFAAAVVANATMYGYNFTIAPTAALDDGMFDIILLKEAPVYKYFLASYRMLNKTIHKSELAINLKSKSVTIESASKDYFHIDGEGFEINEKLVYKMNPKSIKVISA